MLILWLMVGVVIIVVIGDLGTGGVCFLEVLAAIPFMELWIMIYLTDDAGDFWNVVFLVTIIIIMYFP